MSNIAVYCGSSTGYNPAHAQLAKKVGRAMAEHGHTLVYGAGSVGLMGILADEVLVHGGKVIGVIPSFLMDMEVGHLGLTELIVTETMHERKQKMCELADMAIALPGGFGTLDELFEMLTWAQLNLHQIGIGVLNSNGFFDLIIQHTQKCVEEGFTKLLHKELLVVETDFLRLIDKLKQQNKPKIGKWLNKA